MMNEETIVVGSGSGHGNIARLCASLAAVGIPFTLMDMPDTPRRPAPAREITQQDNERIAAAKAKRARKAEKRRMA